MLALLLGGIGNRHYDRVIFVDDSKHNIDAVAARRFPTPVVAYHYTRWNGDLGRSEIQETNRQYRRLRSVTCRAVAASYC
jgi:phosphoglycolate phosphatase-like HAD superfamily hydrolase